MAEGQADIYPRFGPICEWDTAAGQCILTESGGRVVDLQGQTLQYNRKRSLLNPDFIAVTHAEWVIHGKNDEEMKMQKTLKVAVTGAAGQIGYALLFRLASGQAFGPDVISNCNY